MRPILRAAIAAAYVLASGAAHAICNDPPGIVEDRVCMAAALGEAERTMARYLLAAQARANKQEGERIDLAPAQAAWETYRRQHCADVFNSWTPATHAQRAQAECDIKLVRQRTHDLWAAYLTHIDSTPPVLPEPQIKDPPLKRSRK